MVSRSQTCQTNSFSEVAPSYVDGTLGVYELNKIDLLRDVFTWAYERSCQCYLAITKSMGVPDPLRIRYREALIQVVQAIVRGIKAPSDQKILQLAEELVPGHDRESFRKMAMEALRQLHEGNIVRYRLKLSEFRAWKSGYI